jgi:hypothetical protein
MTTQNDKFKVGGWLYFCSEVSINSDFQRWWEIVEIKSEYHHGDVEEGILPGYYLKCAINYAGTKYWYAEYIIQPMGNSIKYVATPEEKLFLQLAEKNL